MMWAYFDETAINATEADGKRTPIHMIVGGCIASTEQWEGFSEQWKRLLKSEGVDHFHANDFFSFNGEFKWFTIEDQYDYIRHDRFSAALAQIIVENIEGILSFRADITLARKAIRVSIVAAVKQAIHEFTKIVSDYSDGISIMLARHSDVSPWAALKIFEQIDWQRRLKGCGVFDPRDMAPLQAADFVLHAMNREISGIESASFSRIKEGFEKRGKQFVCQIDSTADLSYVNDGLSQNGSPSSKKQCE